MATKVLDIIEMIKGLSLIEAAELVKAMEDTFGVSAAAPVAAAGAQVLHSYWQVYRCSTGLCGLEMNCWSMR